MRHKTLKCFTMLEKLLLPPKSPKSLFCVCNKKGKAFVAVFKEEQNVSLNVLAIL